jgi:HAD superfamily hydrolase (TIGR01484 family)
VLKLNLYHRDEASRARTVERIKAAGLETALALAESTSLECSAKGIDKGVGLKKLCEHLGLPLEQTIAVGDADNDTMALKTAGLAVAMGNATEPIKALADVIVADCDHNGCAEAIDKYLLAD